mmetsp:Transcript_18872/g.38405  ORF Transcript_18872/g.38405 Transcript_18872/m.38405 type:complete len:434 (+) Transcript_18872:53-1354(+)
MHILVRGALLTAACAGAYILYKNFISEGRATKAAEPRSATQKTKEGDKAGDKRSTTESTAKTGGMGCFQSKKEEPPADETPIKKPKVETTAPQQTNSSGISDGSELFPKKKKLNYKDFQFMNEKGKVLIKEPGSVNGQPFNIGDCEDCDIYICDYIAQVQIDECKNCRIFIGPTEASIFIRNCTGCKCIMACRQYRARECVDCDTLLYASTAPVVEESKRMRFGCFRFFYFNLAQQLAEVKLSVFDNKWSEIYDFTPADGNWSFLPLDTKCADLMKPLSAVSSVTTKEEEEAHGETSVVPFTVGLRSKEFAGQPRAFVLLMPDKYEEGLKLFSAITDKSLVIIQTKELLLDPAKAKQLFQKASNPALGAALVKKMVVGAEIAGADALAIAQAAAQAGGGEAVAYVSASEDGAAYESNLFFEQWKDFAGSSVTK